MPFRWLFPKCLGPEHREPWRSARDRDGGRHRFNWFDLFCLVSDLKTMVFSSNRCWFFSLLPCFLFLIGTSTDLFPCASSWFPLVPSFLGSKTHDQLAGCLGPVGAPGLGAGHCAPPHDHQGHLSPVRQNGRCHGAQFGAPSCFEGKTPIRDMGKQWDHGTWGDEKRMGDDSTTVGQWDTVWFLAEWWWIRS